MGCTALEILLKILMGDTYLDGGLLLPNAAGDITLVQVNRPLGKSFINRPLGKSFVNRPLGRGLVNRPLATTLLHYTLARNFGFVKNSLDHSLVGALREKRK
jgi:hypothetical protein